MNSRRVRIVSVAAVLVIAAVLIFIYIVPIGTHFAFLSSSSVNRALGTNYNSTQGTSKQTSPGVTSELTTYSIGKYHIVIIIEKFNSSSAAGHAYEAFVNQVDSLDNGPGSFNTSSGFRGFNYSYWIDPLSFGSGFDGAGINGKYLFEIDGIASHNVALSQVGSLFKDQINAMESFSL